MRYQSLDETPKQAAEKVTAFGQQGRQGRFFAAGRGAFLRFWPGVGRRLQQHSIDRKMLGVQKPLHLRQAEEGRQKLLRDRVRVSRRSRFLEKVEASKTNQRNSMSNSNRSTSCRSEQIE
jgi:hypothetical protein